MSRCGAGLLIASLTLTACFGPGREYLAADRGELPVVETARVIGGCDRFAAAVARTAVGELLAGDGPFTVFAPSDDALLTLRADRRGAELLANPVRLTALLRRHVVAGDLRAVKLIARNEVVTIDGDRLGIETVGGQVLVDGARVLSGDVVAQNGVVHFVDRVLWDAHRE